MTIGKKKENGWPGLIGIGKCKMRSPKRVLIHKLFNLSKRDDIRIMILSLLYDPIMVTSLNKAKSTCSYKGGRALVNDD